jgi:SulP family sulfate permease
VAGIIHAMVILCASWFAAPLAGALVLPALAGLLIVTAWTMSAPHRWPERLRLPGGDLAILLLTAALTVFADLTVAIAAGVTLGLAARLASGEIKTPQWNASFHRSGRGPETD